MEFGSGVLDAESPVDAGLSFVPLQLQRPNLPAERILVRQTPPETTAGKDAELDLRHIQPTLVPGGVVKLQPPGDAAGLRRRVKGGEKLGQWGGAKVYHQRSLASVNVRVNCSGEVSQRQAGSRLGG